jgi:hypothetical protein
MVLHPEISNDGDVARQSHLRGIFARRTDAHVFFETTA